MKHSKLTFTFTLLELYIFSPSFIHISLHEIMLLWISKIRKNAEKITRTN